MGAKEPRLLVDLSEGSVDRRVARVQHVVRNRIFATVLNRAIARAESEYGPIVELERVRQIALRILVDDFGVDVRGVVLTFSWDPELKNLGVYVRSQPTAEQVAAAASGDA